MWRIDSQKEMKTGGKAFLSVLLNADEDDFELYTALVENGFASLKSGRSAAAEEEFRQALQFAELTWGPYNWFAADALEHLAYALEKQGRARESFVAQHLSDNIADRQLSGGSNLL